MATDVDGTLPNKGDLINWGGKGYKLGEALGDGGYGKVFLARAHGEKKVAIKTEKLNKSMLSIEVNVLRIANEHGCKHFCTLLGYGHMAPNYYFMIMTLLDKDLHKLRSEMVDKKFTFSTAVRLGLQSLRAIQELHSLGFISRDIKPGNFAPGHKCNKQHNTIFLYDFGLARRYVDKNSNLIPPRLDIGWRGTTRYGSLVAHMRQDLSRRDDLESWVYMLVEMTRGTLPWRLVVERDGVHVAKKNARGAGREQFLFECPYQYDHILTLVDSWSFGNTPDYDQLYAILDQARMERGVKESDRWDWNDEANTTTNTVSSFSDKELRAQKSIQG